MKSQRVLFAGLNVLAWSFFISYTTAIDDATPGLNKTGLVHIATSFMFHPNIQTGDGPEKIRALRAYRRKMKEALEKSLLHQVAFDERGDLLPGQKICLPLMSQRSVEEMQISGLSPELTGPLSLNPNLFVVRTIRAIVRGDFKNRVDLLGTDQGEVPAPSAHWNLNYSNENNSPIDLGYNFDLGKESFTIVALIRLRTKSKIPIRGARILSKRMRNNRGWEFVVPSYYGQTISFYANPIPGHIDYGKSSLPDNTWSAVGIVFDRDTYADGVALITPYIDGLPDGVGTYLEVRGNLSSSAPLTVGHWQDETGEYDKGRRDYRLPGFPRFNPHFQGDIREIFIWKRALTKQQMRVNARILLKKMGRRPYPCPNGYQELDCACYRVFDEVRTFDAAKARCEAEGGTLAMPKTQRIQDFLEILMQQSDYPSFWIGLDDRQVEREKIWADGSPCLYDRRKKQTDFNKFPNNTPDKQYHTEDCVEEVKRTHDFWWNDENCIKLNAFVCGVGNASTSCGTASSDTKN